MILNDNFARTAQLVLNVEQLPDYWPCGCIFWRANRSQIWSQFCGSYVYYSEMGGDGNMRGMTLAEIVRMTESARFYFDSVYLSRNIDRCLQDSGCGIMGEKAARCQPYEVGK